MSYYGEGSDGTGRDVRDHIQRQLDADKARKAYEQTPRGWISKLNDKLDSLEKDRLYWLIENQTGRSDIPAKLAEVEAQIAAVTAERDVLSAELEAQERIEQDAEWTREVTIARRAEWNRVARANPKWKQYKMQQETGYKMDTLKHYIAKWGL